MPADILLAVNYFYMAQLLDEYRNLTGKYEGFRKCHIQPDWLLAYRIDETEIILFPNRISLRPGFTKLTLLCNYMARPFLVKIDR